MILSDLIIKVICNQFFFHFWINELCFKLYAIVVLWWQVFLFSLHMKIWFKMPFLTAFSEKSYTFTKKWKKKLYSFLIKAPANLMHLRRKMNFKMFQKIESFDFKTTFKRVLFWQLDFFWTVRLGISVSEITFCRS